MSQQKYTVIDNYICDINTEAVPTDSLAKPNHAMVAFSTLAPLHSSITNNTEPCLIATVVSTAYKSILS